MMRVCYKAGLRVFTPRLARGTRRAVGLFSVLYWDILWLRTDAESGAEGKEVREIVTQCICFIWRLKSAKSRSGNGTRHEVRLLRRCEKGSLRLLRTRQIIHAVKLFV